MSPTSEIRTPLNVRLVLISYFYFSTSVGGVNIDFMKSLWFSCSISLFWLFGYYDIYNIYVKLKKNRPLSGGGARKLEVEVREPVGIFCDGAVAFAERRVRVMCEVIPI